MSKTSGRMAGVVGLVAWVLGAAFAGASEARVVVRPADTGAALVNPGMGWTLHFYSNMIENYGSRLEPSDTLDDWPGLATIYLRVPWSYLGLLSRICGCAACDAADFSPAFQRVPASKQAAVSRSRKTRPSEESLSGVIPDLPSRLHLRFALNLPGRSEGEGGRGVPPVEPERSPCHVFAPTDSAEEPYLEPKEGEFNWSLLDTPAQRWIAKGKTIALRISCSESWIRYATPRWVQEAGAKGTEFEFGKGPRVGGPLWDPDYLDPVFLEKLDHFLAALARRYDGNPNVAFLDVGSFGMWGEGHTGFSSRLNDEQTLAVVKRHIDLHCKHFPRTLLCISDDVAGSSTPGRHFPAMDYALSKGVTMRDDSILVQAPPHSWYHAEMAQEFWPKLPVILEHEHYGSSKARKAWSGDLLVKSVEDYHASYMSIHWWPREELEENRETVARVNARLGYRLQLREASWPGEVRLGESFEVATVWANAGVAPCYGGGLLAITLKDEKGGIASVNVDEGFDVRSLKVAAAGEATVERVASRFTVAMPHHDPVGTHAPPTRSGLYDVFVSVGACDGTPRIALPLTGDDGQRRYKLGQVRLLARTRTGGRDR